MSGQIVSLGFRAKDLRFPGPGTITGTITEASSEDPLVRRVRLLERATGLLLAETWSDAQGDYSFTALDMSREYLVLAFDHTDEYNMATADHVTPELPA